VIKLNSRLLVPQSMVDANPDVVWGAIDHVVMVARSELRHEGRRLVGAITITVQPNYDVDLTEVYLECFTEEVAS
jgi:hypothetical protein